MKHRLALVALLVLAVSASAAQAAGSNPALGTWKGKIEDSGEGVGFELRKGSDGIYRARSTRLFVVAPCTSNDPNSGVAVRAIRARKVTVALKKVGNQLRGTRTLEQADGKKGTQTVGIRMVFTSTRRAVVTVNARYEATKGGDTSNTDSCKGRLRLTVKPK